MKKRVFSTLAALAIIIGISSPAFASGETGPKNCSDFDTWKQAQDYYEAHGGPEQDPSDLDRDHDGLACEGLPGFDSSYQPSKSDDQGEAQDESDDQKSEQDNTDKQQAAQSNDNNNTNDSQGGEMPETAGNNVTGLFIGGLVAALGTILLLVRKKAFNL